MEGTRGHRRVNEKEKQKFETITFTSILDRPCKECIAGYQSEDCWTGVKYWHCKEHRRDCLVQTMMYSFTKFRRKSNSIQDYFDQGYVPNKKGESD